MKIQLSEKFDYKKLIRFTIPTIAMMIFTSIYGVVDGLFISNCVGSDSFAAINLIMPVLMIVSAVGFMFGTGGSALVSKVLGEGDVEKANKYFSMLTYLLIIFGSIASIIGIAFMKPLATFLGAQRKYIRRLCYLWNCYNYCNGSVFTTKLFSKLSCGSRKAKNGISYFNLCWSN